MTNDMTKGRPLKAILSFSIPMLIGGIFQQIYNLTDTMIIGNTVGSRALAAVGATASSTFFLLSVATGLTSAFSIVMAQYVGAGNEGMVKKTIANAVLMTVISSLIMAVIGIFGARPLMKLLGTPPDILDEAVLYLQICVGCSVGQMAYNGAASLLRALGDSKTPLFFLIISTFLNIFLDFVMILGFDLGVMGVALATVISQILSAVLSITYMIKKYPVFRIRLRESRPDWSNFRMILKIGMSMSIQSVFLSIGEMTVSSVVNRYGTDVVAAYTTVNRVQQFAVLTYLNLSHAFSVYTGQNFGARQFERIKEGFRKICVINVILSIISAIMIFCFGHVLIRLFIDKADTHMEQIVLIAKEYQQISALFYPFLSLIWLYNNTLRGMGEVTIPLVSCVVELIVKVGGSVVLSIFMGYIGIWLAGPVGWAIGFIPSAICYHSGRWKNRSKKLETV